MTLPQDEHQIADKTKRQQAPREKDDVTRSRYGDCGGWPAGQHFLTSAFFFLLVGSSSLG
jgi:hypothetical protein